MPRIIRRHCFRNDKDLTFDKIRSRMTDVVFCSLSYVCKYVDEKQLQHVNVRFILPSNEKQSEKGLFLFIVHLQTTNSSNNVFTVRWISRVKYRIF